MLTLAWAFENSDLTQVYRIVIDPAERRVPKNAKIESGNTVGFEPGISIERLRKNATDHDAWVPHTVDDIGEDTLIVCALGQLAWNAHLMKPDGEGNCILDLGTFMGSP